MTTFREADSANDAVKSTRPPIPPKPKSQDRSKIASLPLSRKDCQLSEVEKIRNDEEHSSFIRGQSSMPTVPFNEKTRRIPPPVSPKPLKQGGSKPLPTSPAASGGDQNFDVTPPLIHPIPIKSDSPTTKSKRLPVHNEIKQPYNYGRQSPNHTKQPPLPLQTQQPPLQTQQSPLQTQQSPLQTQQSPLQTQQSLEIASQPMTIATFLKQHGTTLPVLLKVSQGYKSFLEKYSFGQDQLFVALEKKEIDLVTCEDPNMRQIYEIPLDEELDVSPVLPDCYAEEGIPSLLNSKELLGCSTLPRAFCVMKPFKDSKGDLVEQGTLLFPHKAGPGHPLVAITEENRKVYIDKSTVGEFSIKYSDTKMLLKEAVKYFSFPFSCRLLAAEELDYYGPIVTFKKTLKGLVLKGVTTTEKGDITSSFQKLSVIPASSEIQVTIMKTKETEILEDIYDHAKNVYERLQPSSQPHIQEYQSLISDESDTKAPHHSRRMSVMASRPLPHIPLSEDYRARSPSLPGPNTKLYPIKLRPLVSERMYESVQDIFGSANAPMISTFPNLKPELCQSAPSLLPDEEDSESAYEYVRLSEGESRLQNLQRLKELSDTEVLVLLEKMNLNQYRDTFEEEHIDGVLLASLDNEMLEELGVTKSLHKLRLNKIIEGVQSVEKYFL